MSVYIGDGTELLVPKLVYGYTPFTIQGGLSSLLPGHYLYPSYLSITILKLHPFSVQPSFEPLHK